MESSTPSEILAELLRVSAELESPESKGRRTSLKAYQRKLYAKYQRVAA